MTPALDIAEAFVASTRPLHETEVARFTATGIPTAALYDPDPIRAARVVIDGDRLIFPGELREPMDLSGVFVVPVRDEGGAVIDMAGWRPADGALATWCGTAWCLGEDWLAKPFYALRADGALNVFTTPLSWLCASRRGIVIIDHRAAARHLLWRGPLLAEDFAHGLVLRKKLTIAPPVVLIPSNNERIAA